MANGKVALGIVVVALYALGLNVRTGYSQEKATPAGVQVHMVIADKALRDDNEISAR
jgi:hypothetical protein